MGAKTLAVLLHETDTGFDRSNYLLRALLPLWRDMGYGVDVCRGLGQLVPADALLPHVDLTVTPEPHRRASAQYALTLNRGIEDISKTRISSNLLAEGDTYAGPVIVKTEQNYGGLPEKRLDRLTRRGPAAEAKPAAQPRGARRRPDWSTIRYIRSHNYPVFGSLAEVPAGVFRNPALIVEKFLPEFDGEHYCLRYCYFVGDREVSLLLRARQPVIKGSKSLSCEEVATPAECRAIRERMGFDFGKFDYVLRDGRLELFDVSRTPSISTLNSHPHLRQLLPRLAGGVHSLMARVP